MSVRAQTMQCKAEFKVMAVVCWYDPPRTAVIELRAALAFTAGQLAEPGAQGARARARAGEVPAVAARDDARLAAVDVRTYCRNPDFRETQ